MVEKFKVVIAEEFTKIIKELEEQDRNENQMKENFYRELSEVINLNSIGKLTGEIDKDIEILRNVTGINIDEAEGWENAYKIMEKYENSSMRVENMLAQRKQTIQVQVNNLKQNIEKNSKTIQIIDEILNKLRAEEKTLFENGERIEIEGNGLNAERIAGLESKKGSLSIENGRLENAVENMETFLNSYGTIEDLRKLMSSVAEKEENRQNRIETIQLQMLAYNEGDPKLAELKKELEAKKSEKYGYFDEFLGITRETPSVLELEQESEPEFKPEQDLEEEKPVVEQSVPVEEQSEPVFELAPDLGEVETVVEQLVPEFESALDLGEEETEDIEQPESPENPEEPEQPEGPEDFEKPSKLEELVSPEQSVVEEPVARKLLNKIIIQIGKSGESITTIEREGEEPSTGKALKLSVLDDKLKTSAETAPEADKWVGRELWRNNEASLLSKDEMQEQYSIYLDIMRGKNIEENKKKLKIDLKYDLTGLKGLDRDTKKEIKANAKKAKKLEIAEVETYYSKFTNFVWNKVSSFVTWGLDKLPKAKEPERISAPDDTQRSDTTENISYQERVLADFDSKGAFNKSWKPKKSWEISPEEKQTQQEIARTVAEAMSKDGQSSSENDGVEQEQK